MALNAIVVDNFYADPDAVVKFALEQKFYKPYALCSKPELVPSWAHEWLTTEYKSADQCIFKRSKSLIQRLEQIIGEKIDIDYWNAKFPIETWDLAGLYADAAAYNKKAMNEKQVSASWNCAIHRKFRKNEWGTFVHTHSLDPVNGTGPMGWAGVVYLSPNAPTDTGLSVWKNREGLAVSVDHTTPNPNRWELVDQYANIYNRLIIHRGNVPHSGGSGWDGPPEKARMFQTFFFKTLQVNTRDGLTIDGLG